MGTRSQLPWEALHLLTSGKEGAAVDSVDPSEGGSITTPNSRPGDPDDGHWTLSVYEAYECGPGFYQNSWASGGRLSRHKFPEFLEILRLMTMPQLKAKSQKLSFPAYLATGMQADDLSSTNQMHPHEIFVEKVATWWNRHRVKPSLTYGVEGTSTLGQLQCLSPVGFSGWPPGQLWDVSSVIFLKPWHPSLIIDPPRDLVRHMVPLILFFFLYYMLARVNSAVNN